MGLSIRIIFFEEDGSLRRIPTAEYSRLHSGERDSTFPKYAGKRVRAAYAFVEITNRRVLGVVHVDWVIIPFDDKGRLDARETERLKRLAVGTTDRGVLKGNVADIAPRLAKLALHREFKWRPTPEDVKKLYEFLRNG